MKIHVLVTTAFLSSVSQSAEVIVYANTTNSVAGKPLVFSEYVSGETHAKPMSWTFSGAGYSGRTAWNLPVETNSVLEAWVDVNANGRFDAGEPYGTNAARDYPEIELSDSSFVPRIDLVADVSSSGDTWKSEIDRALKNGRNDGNRAIWATNNVIVPAAVEDGSFRGQRIRVVRWLVNGVPIYRAGGNARVVLDRKIETGVRKSLTEADFLAGDGNAFDIDWAHLKDDVIDSDGVWDACGEVTRMSYLVVVGDGDVGWSNSASTNTVQALDTVIVRTFGEPRALPIDPKVGTWHGVPTTTGRQTFQWMMEEDYTSCRIVVMNGQTTVFDSGMFIAPAKDSLRRMRFMRRDPFPSGTYSWKIAGFSAKFSETDATCYQTNCPPFTVE